MIGASGTRNLDRSRCLRVIVGPDAVREGPAYRPLTKSPTMSSRQESRIL
jgi:hypothetical protein